MKKIVAALLASCLVLAPGYAHADPEAPRSNLPAYVAFGVAGAAAAVGTVYGITALGARSDYDAHPSAANADKAESASIVADVAFGVAFASGVTAIVLLLSNDSVPARKSAFVTPVVGPTGGGIAGGLKF